MEEGFNFARAFKEQEYKEKERKKEKKKVFAQDILSKVQEEEQKSFSFASDEKEEAKKKVVEVKTRDPDKGKSEPHTQPKEKKASFFHRHRKKKAEEKAKEQPQPQSEQPDQSKKPETQGAVEAQKSEVVSDSPKDSHHKKSKEVHKDTHHKNKSNGHKTPRRNILHKELTIKPIHILKVVLALFVVSSIFLAGRVSTEGMTALLVFDPSQSEDVAEPLAQDVPPEEPEPEVDEELLQRLVEEATQKAIESQQEVKAQEVPEEVSVKEEPIVTAYSSVGVSLNGVSTDWKGTWGKITFIDFSIINNEDGTIKPDHFILRVHGYDELSKLIPIPLSGKTIPSKNKYTGKLQVPQGFAYNPVTLGEKTSVPVSITLIDINGQEIEGDTRSFNLNG